MTKFVIEIPARLGENLRQHAKQSGLEPAEVIERALDRYLEDLDDIAEDQRRWAEFERDGKVIPGDAIKAWIQSWGRADELPIPKP